MAITDDGAARHFARIVSRRYRCHAIARCRPHHADFLYRTASFVAETGVGALRRRNSSVNVEFEGTETIVIGATDEIVLDGLLVDQCAVRAHLVQWRVADPKLAVAVLPADL